jgi:hypothetical protein
MTLHTVDDVSGHYNQTIDSGSRRYALAAGGSASRCAISSSSAS